MIPTFDQHRLLPPFVGGSPMLGPRCSPYACTMVELVGRLCFSPRRREITEGLIQYRAELRGVGMTGRQWICGSFVENREAEPNDVDVVTFHTLSADDEERIDAAQPELWRHQETKRRLRVDGYYVNLTTASPEEVVEQAVYWSGMFGHQRNTLRWKGVLQVSFSEEDTEDVQAYALLKEPRR